MIITVHRGKSSNSKYRWPSAKQLIEQRNKYNYNQEESVRLKLPIVCLKVIKLMKELIELS